jgi:ABC-type lipopolysaccharide export system ATPase subunit
VVPDRQLPARDHARLTVRPRDKPPLAQVAALARAGVSLLIVEQRAKEAMKISDRVYVMAGGQVVLNDRADVLLARPDIGEVFLGREVAATS